MFSLTFDQVVAYSILIMYVVCVMDSGKFDLRGIIDYYKTEAKKNV